ncbi:MAG TPA: DUF5655 domain-containing protein [Blastocatellia bacterium]|nr:DUF5655 domain-containing protein [Blastocatellia bacterium]
MNDRAKEKEKKPLWDCPACGQRFVTRNMSHSCGHHDVDEHFVDKHPQIRDLFEALLQAVRQIGPVHVYAQKTRIVFQTRGRFVAVTPRKSHLGGHIWLKRPRSHRVIHRIDSLLDRDFIHNFRIKRFEDLDEEFCDLLREAYSVGRQEFSAR